MAGVWERLNQCPSMAKVLGNKVTMKSKLTMKTVFC